MELTGFETVAPSLRNMRSKPSDQGKRRAFTVLWSGCGTSNVRQREILLDRIDIANLRHGS